jgi:hypothetical protein
MEKVTKKVLTREEKITEWRNWMKKLIDTSKNNHDMNFFFNEQLRIFDEIVGDFNNEIQELNKEKEKRNNNMEFDKIKCYHCGSELKREDLDWKFVGQNGCFIQRCKFCSHNFTLFYHLDQKYKIETSESVIN